MAGLYLKFIFLQSKFFLSKKPLITLLNIVCRTPGKNIKLLLFSAILCLFSMGKNNAQTSDFSTWTRTGIQADLGSKIELEGTEGLRLNNNSSQLDEIYTELSLGYSPWKFLELGGNYRFIHNRKADGSSENLNRFDIDLKLKSEIKRFGFEYRFRWENYPTFANENPDHEFFLRHKLGGKYDIRKCKITPYFSAELFHKFRDSKPDELRKLRYSAGASYKLNKYHRFMLLLRYQNEINVNEPDKNFILNLRYKYYIGRNKKNS